MNQRVTFRIDNAPEYTPDYYTPGEWSNVVFTGNRDFTDITDIEWYQNTVSILGDIDSDTFPGYCLSAYKELTRNQRKALVALYESCRTIDDLETIIAAANIIYPGNDYKSKCIRGYSQGDWQYIMYPASEYNDDSVREIESFYFGNVAKVCFIDEGGVEVYGYITDDSLWSAERNGELKKTLLSMFDIDPDTDCDIFEDDGYERVKKWKQIA